MCIFITDDWKVPRAYESYLLVNWEKYCTIEPPGKPAPV